MNRNLLVEAAVPSTFTGNAGDDNFVGDSGNDIFFLQQGGNDTALGNDGDDGFFFGAALTNADVVNGGTGIDTVALQGDYGRGVALGNITDVNVLFLASGGDTQFGDMANNRYSYWVATRDGNVAAGQVLTLQATGLLPSENITFDGSEETDGGFRIYPGRGNDMLKGGAGSDGFFFGADNNMTGADRVDGGAGVDSIALRGNYVGANAIVFQNSSFTNVEVLAILSSHTNEYGGIVSPNGFDYNITIADGNVAPGQRLDVIAGRLGADETLNFNGAAETNGAFRVISGAANDSIYGGQGNDQLYGRDGDDTIIPGGGSDLVDGGAGDDQLRFGTDFDASDTVIGGAGSDTLWTAGHDYVDSDFHNVTSVETLSISLPGNVYTLGVEADRLAVANGGLLSIFDFSNGANMIDASAMHNYTGISLYGGAGADILVGGAGLTNLFSYNGKSESYGAFEDTIYNFVSGRDVINATYLPEHQNLFLYRVNFVGNFTSTGSAQAALPFNSSKLNAVFDSSTHTLWYDTNNDHILDDHDLSIVLMGVNSLQPHDVRDGSLVFA